MCKCTRNVTLIGERAFGFHMRFAPYTVYGFNCKTGDDPTRVERPSRSAIAASSKKSSSEEEEAQPSSPPPLLA